MRVLVTGASGLLGSAVCDALLARGDLQALDGTPGGRLRIDRDEFYSYVQRRAAATD